MFELSAQVGIKEEGLAEGIFRLIDRDRSGKISLAELGDAMKPTATEVLEALKHKQRRGLSMETLLQLRDRDGDGQLAFGEFRFLLEGLGFNVDVDTAREVFRRLDVDGDGQLSLTRPASPGDLALSDALPTARCFFHTKPG